MKVTVQVDLPDLQKNLSPNDRDALRWAGLSMRLLRSSFAVSLGAVLRNLWPDDEFTVDVRVAPVGMPVWSAPSGVTVPANEKMDQAVYSAGFAWVAALAHLSTVRMEAQKRMAGK